MSGHERIASIFAELRRAGRGGVMPFICGGYPKPGDTASTIEALAGAGASIVEVGIPFSDPIADGPVIAAAMHEALKLGATPRSVFAEVSQARPRVNIGIVAMCSISIVARMGGAPGFARAAQEAGFDGLIIPDAPLEESGELVAAARKNNLALSLLIAPTTPADRAKEIARACSGFVYLLARAGITGVSDQAPDVRERVAMIRTATDLPIACGFGISRAEHVRAVIRDGADAAIVGSALVRAQSQNANPAAAAAAFVKSLQG